MAASSAFLERDRGDLPVATRLFMGPEQTRGWRHFQVGAEERHGFRGGGVAQHEAIRAAHANVELTGEQRQAS